MARTKGGIVTHRRHKKVLNYNKGNFGSRNHLFKRANETMLKSMWYAYRDRRTRKNATCVNCGSPASTQPPV